MTTITIPKEITKKGELIVISREEYEDLLAVKKIREFTPTKAQRQDLKKAIKNFAAKKSISLEKMKYELGIKI